MITIQQIVKEILPPQTLVLNEGHGLSREISWAVVSRSRNPIFEGLKGNELVLISMRSLRLVDEELDLARLFGYLSEMGVAAAAIMGDVSDGALEVAGDLGLPILLLPEGTSLSELERNITKFVSDSRQQLQMEQQRWSQEFTEMALEGKGIAAIAEHLCQISTKATIVEDLAFRVRARYLPENLETYSLVGVGSSNRRNGAHNQISPESLHSGLRELASSVREWFGGKELKASDPPTHSFELTSGLSQMVAPIIAQGVVSSYISIVGREFGASHRIALARAAAACAIERARELAVSAVEDRFQANALDEILDGTFTNPDAVVERGKRLGYNLALPYSVVSFAFRQQEARARKKALTIMVDGLELELDLPISENMARELQRMVDQEAQRRQMTVITRVRDDRFILFFTTGKEFATAVDAKKTSKIFLDRFTTHFIDMSVSAGLGRYYEGIEGLTKCSGEAEKAVTMGLRLFGPGQLTYFGDLGVYRLLLSIGATKELKEFYHEVLGRLLEHDARNGGELLKTLEAYFENQGSPSMIAKKEKMHRNTVLYRIRRIQEITGVDLNENSEGALALHLALRIGEVLGERR
jgi:PucR family transcriptional regulator, purine catabolism regulatory protein